MSGFPDLYWMEYALQLAKKAEAMHEVPVGAVVVSPANEHLGEGFNLTLTHSDPSAHAEILALREAARKLASPRLENATLYTTLEPCPMCAGAIVQARIKRLVFATRDFKTGAAGSVMNLLKGKPLNHQIQIDEGLLQQPCARLLQKFFLEKR